MSADLSAGLSDAAAVCVVRTGVANIASVLAGFRRLGTVPVLSECAQDIAEAARVVLPGVGAMGATMDRVHELGLADAIRGRIARDQPTLAVCMGHQLLGQASEESPGVSGLGVHNGEAVRFVGDDPHLRVPQLGWNFVKPAAGARFVCEGGHAYFANSYCFRNVPQGWHGAQAEYAGDFVAALERGHVLTCQFHPELSGPWGLAVLARWLEASGVEGVLDRVLAQLNDEQKEGAQAC